MWQKLNRIDIIELERARIQLINAIQLVCAGPRSYLEKFSKRRGDWLYWNDNNYSLESCKFGKEERVKITLDIAQFVLSIHGKGEHIEHLVLSGITYPMAYGWMKVKLDAFHLDGEAFSDRSSYKLSRYLTANEELTVTDQDTFQNLVLYYSNAYRLFNELREELLVTDNPLINPITGALMASQKGRASEIGFSPGDRDYPEPYFFLQINEKNETINGQQSKTIGIWNNKTWKGLILPASDFLSIDPEIEQRRVRDFFILNHQRLFQD